ncbi:hypothetical protein [Magnetovibrio blakemorei]|uniref:hypothetical protein n=1 Tax=Magnetovibrio blakemorei TaxID=28181 RepID=UPI001112FF77|nr:hypothetical protein [Magnetovibrio blakemorei]
MTSFCKSLALSAITFTSLTGATWALDGYPPALQNQFNGWCTGQGYTAQICSCAVSKAAIEIPTVAMTSYLAAAEGSAAATVSTGVGATAVQIITTCSASTSGGSVAGAAATAGAIGAAGASFFGK